ITDSSGIASVTATANTTTGTYAVTASVSSVHATFNLTNTAGAATQIAFVHQPTSTVAGQPINVPGGVTVSLKDTYGNPISAWITMSIFGPAETLHGTLTETTDASGIATFSDLSIRTAGTYQLEAMANGGPSARSNSFPITAGSANTITAQSGGSQSAVDGT